MSHECLAALLKRDEATRAIPVIALTLTRMKSNADSATR
jgi:hypothetical protein